MRPRDTIGKNETWETYFYIRQADGKGYYICFKGEKSRLVDKWFPFKEDAVIFLNMDNKWKKLVDEAFEKEFLSGSK